MPAGLQRAHIFLREVDSEIREAAEQDADVLRPDRESTRRVERSRTFQPLSLQSHSMKAATASGEHASIFTFEMLRVPYGCGIGQRDDRRAGPPGASTPPSSGR